MTRFIGSRSYLLYVPPGLPGPRAPLLLSLHGGFLDASSHAIDTGWRAFAASHHFIVAFPSAAGALNFWDDDEDSVDVTFLSNVVAHISGTWCVQPDRVHAEGHSRGANMALRLACDAAGTFASVSEYAGASPVSLFEGCSASRPIAVGVFHGASDFLVPSFLGADVRDEWVERNGCAPIPDFEPVSEGQLHRYRPCDADVEVWWRLYPGQGHTWPTGQRGQDILTRMWDFFEANPLP